MSRARRAAVFVGIFGIVALVLARNTPTAVRSAAVTQSLRDGSLGRLTAAESERLGRIVALVSGATKTPLVVNAPAHGSALPIYTVLPATEHLTRCAVGNAVYDAQLDAIFLHTSLIRIDVLAASRDSAWEATLTFEDFYLALVLLHEIGHRRLHGTTRGAFDVVAERDARDVAREREADAYAVETFARIPAAAIRTFVGDDRAYPLHWFDIDVETLPEQALALANLAASVRLMTYIASAWESPHAAISHTRTHPTMPMRAMGVIDAALRRTDGPVARELRLAKEDMRRFQTMVATGATLFTARDAIKEVAKNGTAFIVRDASGNLYAVDPQTESHPRPTMPRVHGPGNRVAEWWSGMWGSSPDTMHAISREGKIWSVRANRWVLNERSSRDLALGQSGSVAVDEADVRASNRDEAAILYRTEPTAFHRSERRLAVARGARVIQIGSVSDLLARAIGRRRTNADVRLVVFRDDTVFLSIWSGETIDGVIAVGVAPHRSVRFHPLGVRVRDTRAARLLVHGPSSTPIFYLVTTYRADTPRAIPHGLYVFRIAGSHLVCVLGGALSLAEFTPGGRGFDATTEEQPYFEIADAQETAAGTIVVALDADSVYELALSTRSARRIFHPGRVALLPVRSALFVHHQKDSRRGYIIYHRGR